jgi:hypothetical protein
VLGEAGCSAALDNIQRHVAHRGYFMSTSDLSCGHVLCYMQQLLTKISTTV